VEEVLFPRETSSYGYLSEIKRSFQLRRKLEFIMTVTELLVFGNKSNSVDRRSNATFNVQECGLLLFVNAEIWLHKQLHNKLKRSCLSILSLLISMQ